MPTPTQIKLTPTEIETILTRVVPLIAEPADYSFFRGVIGIRLESCANTAEAEAFVSTLLRD